MEIRNEVSTQRIQELIDELDSLGSAADPVYLFGGRNAPIQHYASELVDLPEYTSVYKRILWWSQGMWVHGTLKSMVIDRGGTGKSKMAVADDPEEDKCPTCGKLGYLH